MLAWTNDATDNQSTEVHCWNNLYRQNMIPGPCKYRLQSENVQILQMILPSDIFSLRHGNIKMYLFLHYKWFQAFELLNKYILLYL